MKYLICRKSLVYSKEQASKIRQRFWTRFGQYMKPIPGADGESVNWLNYKTGIKDIYFKMDADKNMASLAIELRHTNELLRKQYYEQLLALQSLLENTTRHKWTWDENYHNQNGDTFSRISQTHWNVNVMNESDWPAIIAFLKPAIMGLDEFWQLVKDSFD